MPVNYTLFIFTGALLFFFLRQALELWARAVFNTLFIVGVENVFLAP